MISPPHFLHYFRELAVLLRESGQPDLGRITELASRYGLEFDFAGMEKLLQEHNLQLG